MKTVLGILFFIFVLVGCSVNLLDSVTSKVHVRLTCQQTGEVKEFGLIQEFGVSELDVTSCPVGSNITVETTWIDPDLYLYGATVRYPGQDTNVYNGQTESFIKTQGNDTMGFEIFWDDR